MSKTNAINIFENEETRTKLNEIQAGVVENLQKTGNSFRIKSQNANLNEKQGSYIFKRYVNSQSNTYGTARGKNKGEAIKAPEVTVNMNVNREIVEEVSKFDAERFGLNASIVSLATRRKTNHEMTMRRDIERAFWDEAYHGSLGGGTFVSGTGSANGTPVDEYIDLTNHVTLETIENEYVDGIDRELIATFLAPKAYSRLKSRLNTVYNSNFSVADEELAGINGVAVFSEMYLPKKVESITLAKESIAQPLSIDDYKPDRIQMSNDFALALFYDFGVKTLAPDTIVVGIETTETHNKVELVDAIPAKAEAKADTVYVASKASEGYVDGTKITSTAYPAGTMFVKVGTDLEQYNK